MGIGRDGEELRGVTDRLRDVIAELKSNRERILTRTEAAPAPAGETQGEALHRLERELEAAREALAERTAAEEGLRARLGALELARRRLGEDHAAIQEQASRATSLFVALERLHGTLDRREVLLALQEVVVNLLGSEQLAVFELGPEGRLRPVHTFGVDPSRLTEIRAGEGAVGRCALGHGFVADGTTRSEDPELTACTPLRVGDRVIGALAVWRLLGHKPFLGDADLELLELLSSHAGAALHVARLHERHGWSA